MRPLYYLNQPFLSQEGQIIEVIHYKKGKKVLPSLYLLPKDQPNYTIFLVKGINAL